MPPKSPPAAAAWPLSLEAVAQFLEGKCPWPTETSTFAAFEMMPVEERIGEWHSVGTAKTIAGAFELLGRHLLAASESYLADSPDDQPELLALLRGKALPAVKHTQIGDENLKQARKRIGSLEEPWARVLLYRLACRVLDLDDGKRHMWSRGSLPLEGGARKAEMVFLAEGGAPYDDFGYCIAKVPPAKTRPKR